VPFICHSLTGNISIWLFGKRILGRKEGAQGMHIFWHQLITQHEIGNCHLFSCLAHDETLETCTSTVRTDFAAADSGQVHATWLEKPDASWGPGLGNGNRGTAMRVRKMGRMGVKSVLFPGFDPATMDATVWPATEACGRRTCGLFPHYGLVGNANF
jgi:hypothetical protein